MRILIPGGDGMLGHQLLRRLRERHDARVTLRQDAAVYSLYRGIAAERGIATGR